MQLNLWMVFKTALWGILITYSSFSNKWIDGRMFSLLNGGEITWHWKACVWVTSAVPWDRHAGSVANVLFCSETVVLLGQSWSPFFLLLFQIICLLCLECLFFLNKFLLASGVSASIDLWAPTSGHGLALMYKPAHSSLVLDLCHSLYGSVCVVLLSWLDISFFFSKCITTSEIHQNSMQFFSLSKRRTDSILYADVHEWAIGQNVSYDDSLRHFSIFNMHHGVGLLTKTCISFWNRDSACWRTWLIWVICC